jgi:hypothetical protein
MWQSNLHAREESTFFIGQLRRIEKLAPIFPRGESQTPPGSQHRQLLRLLLRERDYRILRDRARSNFDGGAAHGKLSSPRKSANTLDRARLPVDRAHAMAVTRAAATARTAKDP